jgi:hypothetical protein
MKTFDSRISFRSANFCDNKRIRDKDENDQAAIAIGDVSGHGISSALLTPTLQKPESFRVKTHT